MEFRLILNKLNNSLSLKEEETFDAWLGEHPEHQRFYKNVKKNYNKNLDNVNLERAWKKVESRIKSSSNPKANYWKYAVAASIVVVLGLSYFFKNTNTPLNNTTAVAEQNINFGTNKATLTLEDGTIVTLEKGKEFSTNALNSNGEKVVYNTTDNKPKKVAYNYLSVPRGGEFKIELSDGTRVWLNSESKIKYPKQFIAGETRTIELIYGEAYFDVSPSTKHSNSKFKVLTSLQEVEVLGTEFNIKAYKNENAVYTTLIEGKVAVKNEVTSAVLKTNEQAVVAINTNIINVNKIDVFNEVSWKNGLFSFENKPLSEIMIYLSRWYDVDIVIQNSEIGKIKFNGVLRKDQKLKDILKIINNSNDFIYDIKNNTVTLK